MQVWLQALAASPWGRTALSILLYFASAWLVHLLARWLSRHVVRLSRVTRQSRRPSQERQQTLQSLVASAISTLALAVAVFLTVGLFVETSTLIWMIGLLSAGFGLSARPLISDFFAGVSFIFEDTFSVGEKVEILGLEGVVEAINLRTTWMRAPSGELYVIPNGEIRTVRNFSRGLFSALTITLKISAADLGRAVPLLAALGQEAVLLLPNLLEPWQVISPSGVIGQQTELELVAQARFGMAADMRPRLLALVQERLAAAGIELGI